MLRYALVYGGAAGAVVISIMIFCFVVFGKEGTMQGQMWFGYLVMLAALSMIFVAVKRYRDRVRGGVIGFLPAFGLGLATAAVAGLVYVAIWEVYLAVDGDGFIETYTASAIEAKRESGLDGEALARDIEMLETMAENYDNPLFRLPITFLEIFPVGLLVALVSAALLRNPKVLPARTP